MRRDMDLIREIILELESVDKTSTSICSYPDFQIEGFSSEQVKYHLNLLIDADWIDTGGQRPFSSFHFKCLTWEGHDFADSVRDEEIWRKTKEGALAVSGYSLDLLKDLAKGFIREKLAKHTGIDM